ncbi:repetitive organellar protein-like [Phymastichus coffea]|uniref:repetitive organellar protein-like n=1 Tax=Phymastichus coffea TaxID=108790 RepID=UPI00273B5D90|nr:repetitive organellar protein-like [Phymastichus coffea]XP_058802619.1 repetitive organellar protein-like [Phymastichus coffea]
MPGCAAIGCNNRSEKGYTMKCFPRDPNLRNLWKQRVGRADWEPSNNSFLCHTHFEANQWVLTPSGRVKLKKGAVPSIFTVTSTRKSPKKRQKLGSQEIIEEDFDEEYEVEFLDGDRPIILNLPNQTVVPNYINVQTQNAVIPTGQFLQNIKIVSSDALKDLRNENIIIVSDESSREIGKIVSDNNFIFLRNDIGKENVHILPHSEKTTSASRIKVEVKEEVIENGLSNDDYDQIERKLEEICQSGNETDYSNNAENTRKINSQSIESTSTFSLDDLENGVDSTSDNSIQETELTITKTGTKRKTIKKIESLIDNSVIATSQITNEIDDTRLPENISNIIQDLESNKSAESSDVQTKSVSLLTSETVQNTQIIKSNKPIIKNDIQLEFRSEILNRPLQIKQKNATSTINPTCSNELLNKLDIQGEVIERLTHQVIMYKDMDYKIKKLTQELQNKNKEIELLNRRAASKYSLEKKSFKSDFLNLNNGNVMDFQNKIDFLEDKNKKLLKTVTLETQNRRKLECRVKNRDNKIKELNWKLEKASKFLDRAEKNAYNYRKKMLSMQALVRRKKLMHEKNSLLDEFLIGQSDQNYSENARRMALEIEKACGQQGYLKLMEYEFPLPNLKDLHGSFNGNVNELGDEDIIAESKNSDKNNDMIYIENVKEEKNEIVENNETNENEKKDSEDMEYVEFIDLDLLNESHETVSGTVQDIFNENSDNEEMDLDELKKHIMINFNDNT